MAEKNIERAIEEARTEGEEIIKEYEEKANSEKKSIEEKTQKTIEEIKTGSTQRLKKAKEAVLSRFNELCQ